MGPATQSRTARTGYTLVVVGLKRTEPLVCIDCIRCGVAICEASPLTITRDPAWLPKQLTMHERTHDVHDVLVHYER